MNEVNKIHLGRQAFSISVDAHHELRNYLDAIKKQVGDDGVVQEIELRMAELLIEHGVNTNKVILPSDVEFLKSQLGDPKDFKEEEGDEDSSDQLPRQSESKRLFRDTDNAMIAGVAAGLAQYFGVDVLLIRILFIITGFITFGWGILLYIALWLLVPEAKTPSERLQMAGRPVNVASLKEIVERADVKGAAHRTNATLAGPINALFRFFLKGVSLLFILFGLSVFCGLFAIETYFLVNKATWAKVNIFPIGFREDILFDIVISVFALFAIFIIVFGIAIFRRKWPIKNWVTGILVGLVFIGIALGAALTADVYPNVQNRYNANVHSSTRYLSPFSSLNITGPVTDINFQTSDKYSVSLSYYGHPNLSELTTVVQNKTLTLDSTEFIWFRSCQIICIPKTYNLTVTIDSPNAADLSNQYGNFVTAPSAPNFKPWN